MVYDSIDLIDNWIIFTPIKKLALINESVPNRESTHLDKLFTLF